MESVGTLVVVVALNAAHILNDTQATAQVINYAFSHLEIGEALARRGTSRGFLP